MSISQFPILPSSIVAFAFMLFLDNLCRKSCIYLETSEKSQKLLAQGNQAVTYAAWNSLLRSLVASQQLELNNNINLLILHKCHTLKGIKLGATQGISILTTFTSFSFPSFVLLFNTIIPIKLNSKAVYDIQIFLLGFSVLNFN